MRVRLTSSGSSAMGPAPPVLSFHILCCFIRAERKVVGKEPHPCWRRPQARRGAKRSDADAVCFPSLRKRKETHQITKGPYVPVVDQQRLREIRDGELLRSIEFHEILRILITAYSRWTDYTIDTFVSDGGRDDGGGAERTYLSFACDQTREWR